MGMVHAAQLTLDCRIQAIAHFQSCLPSKHELAILRHVIRKQEEGTGQSQRSYRQPICAAKLSPLAYRGSCVIFVLGNREDY
jgi:hypothetical protein